MSIRWTGHNFGDMIAYFKGYKMKIIKLFDSSITHSDEMSDFLKQCQTILFWNVNIINPERALIPRHEKILTKRVEFYNVKDSMINI
jgi:hypothetical protein